MIATYEQTKKGWVIFTRKGKFRMTEYTLNLWACKITDKVSKFNEMIYFIC